MAGLKLQVVSNSLPVAWTFSPDLLSALVECIDSLNRGVSFSPEKRLNLQALFIFQKNI